MTRFRAIVLSILCAVARALAPRREPPPEPEWREHPLRNTWTKERIEC